MAAKTTAAAKSESNVPVDYRTVDRVTGPLLFVRDVQNAAYGEIVEITLPNGERRQGQVLDSRKGLAIVQVFGPTMGMNVEQTSVKFLGEVARLAGLGRDARPRLQRARASLATAGPGSSRRPGSRSSGTP